MCLIITAISAIFFGAYYHLTKRCDKDALMLFLMLAAAALMWCVDGVAALMSGEDFFDLSLTDAKLGVIIVSTCLVIFGVLKARKLFSHPQ